MNKQRKVSLVVVVLYFMSCVLIAKIQNPIFGEILMLLCFFILNYIEFKNALHSVRLCICFLLLNSFFLGLIFSYLVTLTGYIKIDSLEMLISFAASYLLLWLIIIYKAESQVAKLATMIIGQAFTVFSLIASYIVNVLPLQTITQLDINFSELSKYGYSPKDLFNIMIQTLLYPALIVALTTYVIIEVREYKNNKNSRNNFEVD